MIVFDEFIYLFIYSLNNYNHDWITVSENVQIEIDIQARDSNVGRLYVSSSEFDLSYNYNILKNEAIQCWLIALMYTQYKKYYENLKIDKPRRRSHNMKTWKQH